MLNGPGFIYDHVSNLWLVEVATGAARRLTTGRTNHEDPVFSPDGTRVAYVAQGGRDPDLGWQFDVHVVDVASGRDVRITDEPARHSGRRPAGRMPDRGRAGHRYPRPGAAATTSAVCRGWQRGRKGEGRPTCSGATGP